MKGSLINLFQGQQREREREIEGRKREKKKIMKIVILVQKTRLKRYGLKMKAADRDKVIHLN